VLAWARAPAGLMATAAVYWDAEQYSAVERIFRQSAEFCSEHDTWKLNVAHNYFMQVGKPAVMPCSTHAKPCACQTGSQQLYMSLH
jgi:hypothetical protein